MSIQGWVRTNNNGKKTQQPSGGGIGEDGEDGTWFNHLLIAFGGVAGIEECVDADESMLDIYIERGEDGGGRENNWTWRRI